MSTLTPLRKTFLLVSKLGLLTASLSACGAAAEGDVADAGANEGIANTAEALSIINAGLASGAMVDANIDAEPEVLCGAVVANNHDAGAGSLREAVLNPPSLGAICFSATAFGRDVPQVGRTIRLKTPIELTKSVIIAGPSDPLIVSGDYASRVFIVSGVKVTLSGFTVAHSEGSAIRNNGNLTLNRMTVRDNHEAVSGGGLYNNGTLRVVRSTFSNNDAEAGGGGAIYSYYSDMTIERSTFEYNFAGTDGGGIAKISGNLTISKSHLHDNQALRNGGAIYNWAKKLTLTDSTLEYNAARAGGAVHQETNGVTTTELRDTTVVGNLASQSGGGFNNSDSIAWLKMFGSSVIAYNAAGSHGGIAGGSFTGVVVGTNVFLNTPSDL